MKNNFYSNKFKSEIAAGNGNYHLTTEEFNNCTEYYDKLADIVINHEADDLPKDKLGNLLGMLYGSHTDWTKELLQSNFDYLTEIGVPLNDQSNIGFNLFQQNMNNNIYGMNIDYFATTLDGFGN